MERRNVPQNRFQEPTPPPPISGRFKLGSKKEEFTYKPDPRKFSYYQICQFPLDKQYSVRKLIYDEMGELITFRETKLKKKVLDKFLGKAQEYKYAIYPAYTLDVVKFPDANEMLTLCSRILNEY